MKNLIRTLCLACIALLALSASARNPIYDLIDRIDDGASRKFDVQIKPDGGTNYFELDSKGKKIVIRANSIASAGVGLNWYLKYHAGIHLAWNNPTADLSSLPLPQQKERHESDFDKVYDFNYCTFSYTMPFWDWKRWEQEIDWMVLHGVNIPLAAVGEECVYRNMLLRLGYTNDEVNQFISGPAFTAWWAMNNLEGWGGPNPDSWYERQEALQKQIVARMKDFGMHPVFPGYSGMMPSNAGEKLGLNLTITVKPWNGFTRPAFLQPTDSRYAEIANIYYEELEKLFGKADYYSMDPFHELSNAQGVDFAAAGQAIMKAMKAVNPKAVWVIQGWTENPREAMIDPLQSGDLLILDLFAECRPMWGAPSMWRREQGYKQHDWLFCMLENFGGNVGMHGRMDQLLNYFYMTKDNPLAKNLRGIGFTMEGSENNPVMFELMSELPWRPEKFTKEEWLSDYVKARYGTDDPQLQKAWEVLANSIYNCPMGNNQQGTHESIFCCRPNMDNFQASSWSKMANYYDHKDTREAARLFVEAAPRHRGNNNFEYDLVDVVRQAIADHGRYTYQHAIADFKAYDKQGYFDKSQKFLKMILLQDKLLATRPEFTVGRWINFARQAATNPEEAKLFEWNARVQITTWGARENADKGKLRDYAHKEWSGLLRDFYYKRWSAFFQTLQDELDGQGKAELIDFYALEEPWTLQQNDYSFQPDGDPVDTAIEVYNAVFGPQEPIKDFVGYVDTRTGTAPSQTKTAGVFGKNTEEFGQTLPAVLMPNGMNFWAPQTQDTELKCIAPYYYLDEKLQGFRNSHWIVGGCTQDYGSMTLMPLKGELRCLPFSRATSYDHSREVARPDYYKVQLPDEGITAEMTGTSRAAIFKFRYDQGGKAHLVVNPNNDEQEGYIAIDTLRNMIYGYNPVHRIYQGKGEPAGFSGYFVVMLDRKPSAFGTYRGEEVTEGALEIGNANEIGCYVTFDVTDGETVMVKAASSFTSLDGAMRNLQAEIPHWDFQKTRSELNAAWQKRLGQVEVDTSDRNAAEKFYGALYRASFLPHEVSDADGQYCQFSTGAPARLTGSQKAYYDDFSMWDTYRALHPLQTLLNPTMSGEMMQSLVLKYQQGGWLPIFPCWNSYTAAMIGDHCIATIADAYAKGVRNFDVETAYRGMRQNAFSTPTLEEYNDGKGRRALDSYLKYGYIPLEDSVPQAYHKREQVSRTLEYAFDDFALSTLAKSLGYKADYQVLSQRAKNYLNVINPATGYVCGRYADGTFAADDPFSFSKHITEGAPCHYTWYVPHDPEGLIQALGGKEAFVQKLDSMFTERRYWHGNEPCHQVAYMYAFADAPHKISEQVRHIMDTEYLNCPGGLSGNDDAGQMSAWYVFAALGFYPVCPSTPYYIVSGPTFSDVKIHLENGNVLHLSAPAASAENIYVKRITRNGKPYSRTHLDHADLMQGGEWVFEMTNQKE